MLNKLSSASLISLLLLSGCCGRRLSDDINLDLYTKNECGHGVAGAHCGYAVGKKITGPAGIAISAGLKNNPVLPGSARLL